MKRRTFLASTLTVASLPRIAVTQSGAKIARIGWLTTSQAAGAGPFIEAFRAGLADLGHVEGRSIAIEFRFGNDVAERVPELATELARLPVDVLVAVGAVAFRIRNLGLPVPIVYVSSSDPVSAGFAESLARPKGNMTGVTLMAVELNGKRLELLQEIIPGLRRVGLIGNPEHPGAHLEFAFSEETARRMGLIIAYSPTRTREELAHAFAKMAADPPQAISVLADGFSIQHRQSIIDFATRHRAPVISAWPAFAHSGAICTFGPRITESHRRLAYFVDRILKGAKPTDLPFERPTKFELVVNQRAAKTLGITLPHSLIVRADDVIE